MSAILDQFEVEPAIFRSGSYTDIIMSGTIGVGNGRQRIGLNSSGSDLLRQISLTVERLSYTTFAAHQKHFNIGYNQFAQFYCPNETFIDSLPPSPVDIYRLGSGQFVFSAIDASAPWNLRVNAKLQLGYRDVYMTSSAVMVTDRDWLQSHPFQGRYSSLSRLQVPLTDFSVLATYEEFHSGAALIYTAYTASGPNEINQSLLEILSLSSSNGKTPLFPLTTFGTSYGTEARTTLELMGKVLPNIEQFSVLQYVAPTSNNTYMAFFGIGDGFRNQPQFDNVITTLSGGFSSGSFSYHPVQGYVIRGFKYGLYNAVPVTTKMVWRAGKFGQFRDRLEQRQQTKFFDMHATGPDGLPLGRRGPTEAVVTNRFVSGSAAAFSSSFPLTQNTHDSGIYDFECKAGQPWYDSD